jgi:DNA-binding transcriptional LysR family regulator
MKFRHLEYFIAAAEELNFTHAADRLHVSQPPFSKQIHDLEAELGIDLFERQRKGVALTLAGKSFLIDARRILEECHASIRKAQRISRGEIGELAIGYMSALTQEFLGKALEVWRLTAPDIVVDCIEMDCISQERALLEGRIAVGLLVPSDRPSLELLQVRLLTRYPVKLALPKSHPYADKPEIPLALLKEEPFIGLKSHVSQLRRLAPESLPTLWFQAANCQGGGRSPKRTCLCSSGLRARDGQRTIAEDTSQGCDFPRFMSRGPSVDAGRGRLETGFLNRSRCFQVHRRIGSSL